MKHIFLTGYKHIGKSTVINKTIFNNNINIAGFKTYWENNNLIMQDIASKKRQILAVRDIKIKKVYQNIFETFGSNIIESTYNYSLTVLDEFGFLECKNESFVEKVYNRLNCSNPILGVVRKSNNDFINTIKAKRNVEIIEVTKNNRDKLPIILKKYLKLR